MASAPSKHESGLPREDVEELLMHEAMFLQSSKLIAEFEEKGFALVLAEVRHRKAFEESFDKLLLGISAAERVVLGTGGAMEP